MVEIRYEKPEPRLHYCRLCHKLLAVELVMTDTNTICHEYCPDCKPMNPNITDQFLRAVKRKE